jgi:signal transduction histidine kinase
VPIRTRINLAFARAVGVLLAIAAASMRLGGQAGVESEPGAGSRFWIELAETGGAMA